jgi:hypothetical protein
MPLIWGEMGRGIFLLEGLDRANHVETVPENRFSAHVDNLPDGQNKPIGKPWWQPGCFRRKWVHPDEVR